MTVPGHTGDVAYSITKSVIAEPLSLTGLRPIQLDRTG